MLVMNTEEKEVREGVVTYYGDLTTTANYLCRFQKDEAEDLTQQTVTQALTHTSQYKPGTNIKGWLLTIMHNLFVNLYRKEQYEVAGVINDTLKHNSRTLQELREECDVIQRKRQSPR